MAAKQKNPHNAMVPLDPPHTPNRRWRCRYCGMVGTMEELRAAECTYEYPPCNYCGQTPECAPDCKGIALALSGALTPAVNVHIAGSIDPSGEEN